MLRADEADERLAFAVARLSEMQAPDDAARFSDAKLALVLDAQVRVGDVDRALGLLAERDNDARGATTTARARRCS